MKTLKTMIWALAAVLAVSCTQEKDTPSPQPSFLKLSQDEITLQVGESEKLEANQPVSWMATNDHVSVDPDGLVKAISQGTAYVVAETPGGLKASCLVNVLSHEEESRNSSGEIYTEEPVKW